MPIKLLTGSRLQ